MQITKIGFPSIMMDNDMKYLSEVFSIIQHIDDDAEVIASKSISSYSFTIIPSGNFHKQLINAITKFHKSLHILIEFSRSVKISSMITFYLV